MITFAPYPIPCVTELGDAYLIYVQSSEMYENDIWTCCLCETGEIKHFNTSQIRIYKNQTFNINERKTNQETKNNG